ncbi:hypothetical protein HYU23_03195 [Candidatus Woesearchaeota archaeon]|nr:hypothetical protein [Candidatus Woesearchaeota archaeon]
MVNLVYIHAYVEDAQIKGELTEFYYDIKSGSLEGLRSIKPVLTRYALDDLARHYPLDFQTAVSERDFVGFGLWT